jgi:hypothetical protein
MRLAGWRRRQSRCQYEARLCNLRGRSVISRQNRSSLRGNRFDSLHVTRGDTIVIPLNLDKGNTMRLIVNIAQIMGQFGIAVANTVLGQ